MRSKEEAIMARRGIIPPQQFHDPEWVAALRRHTPPATKNDPPQEHPGRYVFECVQPECKAVVRKYIAYVTRP